MSEYSQRDVLCDAKVGEGSGEEVSRKIQLSNMDVWHELRSPAVPEPEVPQEPLKVFLGDTGGEEGPWICRETERTEA